MYLSFQTRRSYSSHKKKDHLLTEVCYFSVGQNDGNGQKKVFHQTLKNVVIKKTYFFL